MSVYKSRRKDAAAGFIAAARELRKTTMRIIRKFPTSYRWIITNNMLALANEVYTNAVKGNAIYVHKDMSRDDYALRHRYMMIAATSAEALLAEITFCYELVDDGNNYLGSSADYNRVFQNWTTAGCAALQLLRGVIDSDKKRWKNYEKRQPKPADAISAKS